MKYIIAKEPFVLMKAAMSLDGKIATSSGESKWISSEKSREEVQELRRFMSGIMVGIGTVLADDPELTCRIPDAKSPTRIIVDSSLRIPIQAKVLKNQNLAKTIIAATNLKADPDKLKELKDLGIEVILTEDKNGRVNLKQLMSELGKREIDSILLEGGSTLNYAAVEAEIIDKVIMYVAPIIIGGENSKNTCRWLWS